MKTHWTLVLTALFLLGAYHAWAAGTTERVAVPDSGETVTVSYFFDENPRHTQDPLKHIPLAHLAQKFNIKWDFIGVPTAGFLDKFTVTLASGNMPDLTLYQRRDWPVNINSLGDEGYFLDFVPHLQRMPNLVKNYYGKWPDLLKYSLTDTGKLYYIGRLKSSTADNFSAAFQYRKDVLDKHGLKPPETFDQLYQTLKKLRQLYPDVSPLSHDSGITPMLSTYAQLFETGVGAYFDFWGTPGYKFGPIESKYKAMLEFLTRLHKERLLHPDFNAPRATFQKLAINNQIFMGVSTTYIARETITLAGRKENNNPAFDWMHGPFPSYKGPGRISSYLDVDSGGKIVSAKTKHAARIVAMLDYMATPEYSIVQLYGIEGETFAYDAAHNPQHVPAFRQSQPKWDRGLEDDERAILGYPPGLQEAGVTQWTREQLAYYDDETGIGGGLPDDPYLSFSESESETLKQLVALDTYVAEMALKFIVGDSPLSQWDAYVRQCEQLGASKKLAAYNQAYERYKKRDTVAVDLLKNLKF